MWGCSVECLLIWIQTKVGQQIYYFQIMHIQVEHCINCHLHNWCSRHNQEKYQVFFHRIVEKAKAVIKNVTVSENEPPEHYTKHWSWSAAHGTQVERYYDQGKQEFVNFPRHGSFEIKINGMLIFSKIQSSLWPNTDKIGFLLGQIKDQFDNSGNIKQFSLEYRLQNQNEDEHFVDTYKKVIKFKINRRPHSSQYNSSAVYSKVSVEQSSDIKPGQQIRRNVVSLKKSLKYELEKRPIIRLKNKKQEGSADNSNPFNQFREGDQYADEQFPTDIVKAPRAEKYSPRGRKILHKKELGPIKTHAIEIPNSQKEYLGRLEKKGTKKLVIKANEKKSDEGSAHKTEKLANIQKITEKIEESESVVIQDRVVQERKETPKEEKVEAPTPPIQENKQKQQALVENIKDQEIEKPVKEDPIIEREKLSVPSKYKQKEQSSNDGYEDLMDQIENEDFNSSESRNQKGEQTHKQAKTSELVEMPRDKEPQGVKDEDIEKNQSEKKSPAQYVEPEKKKSYQSNDSYDEEKYDDYEEQEEIVEDRPITSSNSRRGERSNAEGPEFKEDEGLKANFRKKTDVKLETGQNQQSEDQQYEEQFPIQERSAGQEIPIIVNKDKNKKQVKDEQYEEQYDEDIKEQKDEAKEGDCKGQTEGKTNKIEETTPVPHASIIDEAQPLEKELTTLEKKQDEQVPKHQEKREQSHKYIESIQPEAQQKEVKEKTVEHIEEEGKIDSKQSKAEAEHVIIETKVQEQVVVIVEEERKDTSTEIVDKPKEEPTAENKEVNTKTEEPQLQSIVPKPEVEKVKSEEDKLITVKQKGLQSKINTNLEQWKNDLQVEQTIIVKYEEEESLVESKGENNEPKAESVIKIKKQVQADNMIVVKEKTIQSNINVKVEEETSKEVKETDNIEQSKQEPSVKAVQVKKEDTKEETVEKQTEKKKPELLIEGQPSNIKEEPSKVEESKEDKLSEQIQEKKQEEQFQLEDEKGDNSAPIFKESTVPELQQQNEETKVESSALEIKEEKKEKEKVKAESSVPEEKEEVKVESSASQVKEKPSVPGIKEEKEEVKVEPSVPETKEEKEEVKVEQSTPRIESEELKVEQRTDQKKESSQVVPLQQHTEHNDMKITEKMAEPEIIPSSTSQCEQKKEQGSIQATKEQQKDDSKIDDQSSIPLSLNEISKVEDPTIKVEQKKEESKGNLEEKEKEIKQEQNTQMQPLQSKQVDVAKIVSEVKIEGKAQQQKADSKQVNLEENISDKHIEQKQSEQKLQPAEVKAKQSQENTNNPVNSSLPKAETIKEQTKIETTSTPQIEEEKKEVNNDVSTLVLEVNQQTVKIESSVPESEQAKQEPNIETKTEEVKEELKIKEIIEQKQEIMKAEGKDEETKNVSEGRIEESKQNEKGSAKDVPFQTQISKTEEGIPETKNEEKQEQKKEDANIAIIQSQMKQEVKVDDKLESITSEPKIEKSPQTEEKKEENQVEETIEEPKEAIIVVQTENISSEHKTQVKQQQNCDKQATNKSSVEGKKPQDNKEESKQIEIVEKKEANPASEPQAIKTQHSVPEPSNPITSSTSLHEEPASTSPEKLSVQTPEVVEQVPSESKAQLPSQSMISEKGQVQIDLKQIYSRTESKFENQNQPQPTQSVPNS